MVQAQADPGERAFTIVELLIVVVILGTLSTIAVPSYSRVRERALVVRAIGDIKALQQDIVEYQIVNGELPASLGDVGRDQLTDPWGNSYEYRVVEGSPTGALRKDRFLVPINGDFDLYSMGPDGRSVASLTAEQSRDDIVRANNGGFVGEASTY